MAAVDVHVRLYRDDDAAQVTAVWRAAFDDHGAWRAPEAILARRARRQRELFLVAARGDRVVGAVLAGYDGHRGWLYRLAVLPDERRHGVGRALVTAAEARLRQLGCPKLNLQIEGGNRDVVGFYERLGFAVEDRVGMGKPLPVAAPAPAAPVGIYLPQVGFAWDELRERVVLADAEGIPSVWLMDHLYPPTLPQVPSFEAMTAATALAAVTERIRIGHLVLCNGFRHPALLAKMAITLDHVSRGRFDLGLGSGSYAPEFTEAGLPFPGEATRAAQLGEALAIVRACFTDERVTFSGAQYRVRDLPSLPRPVQRPHPPIHVGGAGEKRTLPLVARHADVWNCPTYALGAFERKRDVLRAECAAIGRDPKTLRVTEEAVLVLVARRDRVDAARAAAEKRFPGPGWGLADGGYVGTPDDVVRRIEARRRVGVDGVVFFLFDRGTPETLALLAREVLPAVAAAGA